MKARSSQMTRNAASPPRLGRLLEGMADIVAGALLALYFSPRVARRPGKRPFERPGQASLVRAPFP